MKSNWRGLVTVVGLSASLVATSMSTGCVVRGSATVTPAVVTVVDEGPPPPRYETPAPRRGYVWLQGHWSYSGNRWVWVRGRWERERRGYAWQPASWENRGGRYYYVEGRWVTGSGNATYVANPDNGPAPRPAPPPRRRDYRSQPAPAPTPPPPAHTGSASDKPGRTTTKVATASNNPTSPPPAPQAENPGRARPGKVWLAGHYRWNADIGRYEWMKGRWATEQRGKRWVAGRWERRGDYYFWVEGSWQ